MYDLEMLQQEINEAEKMAKQLKDQVKYMMDNFASGGYERQQVAEMLAKHYENLADELLGVRSYLISEANMEIH